MPEKPKQKTYADAPTPEAPRSDPKPDTPEAQFLAILRNEIGDSFKVQNEDSRLRIEHGRRIGSVSLLHLKECSEWRTLEEFARRFASDLSK